MGFVMPSRPFLLCYCFWDSHSTLTNIFFHLILFFCEWHGGWICDIFFSMLLQLLYYYFSLSHFQSSLRLCFCAITFSSMFFLFSFYKYWFYSDWVIIFREQRISQNCTGQYVVICETCFWGSDAWLKLIVYEKKNFSEF